MESEGLRSWVLTMVYRGRYSIEDLRFGAYEDLVGFRVYHKVLPSLSRREPSRMCLVCLSRPFWFFHPRSSSMPIHSGICQEDTENGSHDEGIGMEMDEVNSSFSRLSLSSSFD